MSSAEQMKQDLGPALCLAKWKQVSLHLQTGMNNSCYHPPLHPIDPKAIAQDPGALHNTQHKKQQRVIMLHTNVPANANTAGTWKTLGNSAIVTIDQANLGPLWILNGSKTQKETKMTSSPVTWKLTLTTLVTCSAVTALLSLVAHGLMKFLGWEDTRLAVFIMIPLTLPVIADLSQLERTIHMWTHFGSGGPRYTLSSVTSA